MSSRVLPKSVPKCPDSTSRAWDANGSMLTGLSPMSQMSRVDNSESDPARTTGMVSGMRILFRLDLFTFTIPSSDSTRDARHGVSGKLIRKILCVFVPSRQGRHELTKRIIVQLSDGSGAGKQIRRDPCDRCRVSSAQVSENSYQEA